MTTEQTKGGAIEVMHRQVSGMTDQFLALMPPGMSPTTMIRVCVNSLLTTPDIEKCSPRSVALACMQAARQGLMPDGKEGVLIAFRQKDGTYRAEFLAMAAGVAKRMYATGKVSSVSTNVVYAADRFEYHAGDNESLLHVPAITGDRGDLIAAYAIAKLTSGAVVREVLRKDELDTIKATSRAGNAGPWGSWYSEMCRKTALKRLAKRLPLEAQWAEVPQSNADSPAPAAEVDSRRVELTDPVEFLRGARTSDELEDRWRVVLRQIRAGGGELPLPIEAMYHDRREALASRDRAV